MENSPEPTSEPLAVVLDSDEAENFRSPEAIEPVRSYPTQKNDIL